MTDFAKIVVVLPTENVISDDNTLFVSGTVPVTCII